MHMDPPLSLVSVPCSWKDGDLTNPGVCVCVFSLEREGYFKELTYRVVEQVCPQSAGQASRLETQGRARAAARVQGQTVQRWDSLSSGTSACFPLESSPD